MKLWIVAGLAALLVAGCGEANNGGTDANNPTGPDPAIGTTNTPPDAAAPTAPPTPREVTAETPTEAGKEYVTKSGLRYTDVQVGNGDPLKAGRGALVHYVGTLENGTKFDSSRDRAEPFEVKPVGSAQVIQGWNEGLQGMKIGGIRRLIIPSALGYGDQGSGSTIPPGATLVFEIELLEIR